MFKCLHICILTVFCDAKSVDFVFKKEILHLPLNQNDYAVKHIRKYSLRLLHGFEEKRTELLLNQIFSYEKTFINFADCKF